MLAEDGQQYARVTRRLGDGRFEVLCLGDGETRLAHVRGKMWKRVWVAPHDGVLVALRAVQDCKTDVVHKYTDDEARSLARAGEIGMAALVRREDDDAYERGLQRIRDVHGVARAGFMPTEDDLAFEDPEAD